MRAVFKAALFGLVMSALNGVYLLINIDPNSSSNHRSNFESFFSDVFDLLIKPIELFVFPDGNWLRWLGAIGSPIVMWIMITFMLWFAIGLVFAGGYTLFRKRRIKSL
jgi:hypothetical protein